MRDFGALAGVTGLASDDSRRLVSPPACGPEDSGLGGRLVVRTPRGGCGNELMLICFFKTLPDPADDVCNFVGVLVVVVGAGSCEEDAARRPPPGVFTPGGFRPESEERVLGTGRAGKAAVGGPCRGFDGLGIVVAIVSMDFSGPLEREKRGRA